MIPQTAHWGQYTKKIRDVEELKHAAAKAFTAILSQPRWFLSHMWALC